MIFVRLSGRIGNYLFQIAAAASLAKQNDTDFCALIAPDGFAIDFEGNESMSKYLEPFRSTIFRHVQFVQAVSERVRVYRWHKFQYKPIEYVTGEDILLEGNFQCEKYLDRAFILDLFSPTDDIKNALCQRYKDILAKHPTCINVRRGDYCKLPHRFNICSMSYFKKAIQIIGRDAYYLVISDDIKWCKKHFKGDNFFFTDDKRTILEDLYLQSMCINNIISNSSFSWWGAWLNANIHKKVICPTPWFGPHNSRYESADLCPESWIRVYNRESFYFQTKANIIRARMKLERFIDRFKR